MIEVGEITFDQFAAVDIRVGRIVEVGEPAAERLQGVALGLDEHDSGGHGVWVSPGFRTTTSAAPAFWTSDLNASTSVSTGGNVL